MKLRHCAPSAHAASGLLVARLVPVLALALACQTSSSSAQPSAHAPTAVPAADTPPKEPASAPADEVRKLTFAKARPAEHEALVAKERELAAEPVGYAAKDQSERFRPKGLYLEPHTGIVWVWSSDHPAQRGFVRSPESWVPVAAQRKGPLDTRRCVALSKQPLTLCLGLLQPGGIRGLGRARFAAQLPQRGGFRDFAVSEARGRVYVIDSYLDSLWVLDLGGRKLATLPLTPTAYRVGMLGSSHIFVLAGNQPHLSIYPLDERGMPSAPVGIETPATIREAVYDAKSDLFWTAGYRQASVRRDRGYIAGLESFVYAYRPAELLRGQFLPVHAVDLSQHKLTDPVSLTDAGGDVFVAAAGSHALVRLSTKDLGVPLPALTRVPSAFVPQAVLVHGDEVLTAGLLDSRIYVHATHDLAAKQVIELDPESVRAAAAEPTWYQIGEVVYYSKVLWGDSTQNQFTCNTCHWDGMTDYRVHPGFRETRWEQIRPAAGAGMLAPIFSPGQSANLAIAVNGFVLYLDERYWLEPKTPVWLDDVDVEVAPGRKQRLSAYDVRLALLTYLARRPVEPGYLRPPGNPFSASAERGAALFFRDCVSCHEPRSHQAWSEPLGKEAALAYLRNRPLAFGAARFAKTGVEPYFVQQGNRISPLIELSRGGPFFTNGSARTLADALRRSNPQAPAVHAPQNAESPYYSADELTALMDFLLSL